MAHKKSGRASSAPSGLPASGRSINQDDGANVQVTHGSGVLRGSTGGVTLAMFASACSTNVEHFRLIARAAGVETSAVRDDDELDPSLIERFANVLTSQRQCEARMVNIS